MFTFDRFEPGKIYGTFSYLLTPEAVADWRVLFPDDETGPLMPPGMTAVVTMHAYGALITPRPPGNIHGGQRFEMYFLPRIGDMLHTTVCCVDKAMRKGRRIVHLGFDTRDAAGRRAFSGLFTSLVAV